MFSRYSGLRNTFITLNPNFTNSDDKKQFIFFGLSIRNVKNHRKIKKIIEMQTNLHRIFYHSFIYVLPLSSYQEGRVGILLTGLTPTLCLCLS
jgi:hypothetical protein